MLKAVFERRIKGGGERETRRIDYLRVRIGGQGSERICHSNSKYMNLSLPSFNLLKYCNKGPIFSNTRPHPRSRYIAEYCHALIVALLDIYLYMVMYPVPSLRCEINI